MKTLKTLKGLNSEEWSTNPKNTEPWTLETRNSEDFAAFEDYELILQTVKILETLATVNVMKAVKTLLWKWSTLKTLKSLICNL